MNDNEDDSLEEGEIPSPFSSPRQRPRTPPSLKKNDRRKRRRRDRSHSNKCSHCGSGGQARDKADDFDQMRNKYFLRLRREKAMKKSREFMSRLPKIPHYSSIEDKPTENTIDDSDDNSDVDKLRDHALFAQITPISSQDVEDELDEFSLRAEALKTALVKKSRFILNKKLKKEKENSEELNDLKEDKKPEPMICEEKENESLDEIKLRQQLLENLVVVRRKNMEPKINTNLPLSSNRNSLNQPSTSKTAEMRPKPVTTNLPRKMIPNVTAVKKIVTPVTTRIQANPRRFINLNNTKKVIDNDQGRIVVRLGADSSDDDDDLETEPKRTVPVPTKNLVESKIDEFLLNARKRVEAKQETPKVVSDHLPLSQRLEYRRLKKTLAEKEQKMKSNKLGEKPVAKAEPQISAIEKQTRLVAKKLLAILRKEEIQERRAKEELARLQMQISCVEQKMLAHAKNAGRVRTRLKGLLLGGKKLTKPVIVSNPSSDKVPSTSTDGPSVLLPPIVDTKGNAKEIGCKLGATTAISLDSTDVACKLSAAPTEFSDYKSPLNHTSCGINPLLELCPHDLAGTCRDPHCKYQHTGSQTKVPI